MKVFTQKTFDLLPSTAIYPLLGAYDPPINKGKDRITEKTINLLHFISRCKSQENKKAIEELRAMMPTANNGAQQAYKANNLPFITPHGVFPIRNNQSLPQPSWLACLDCDHVADAPLLKARLIADKTLGVVAALISPRGEGVKVFTVVPHPSSPVSLEGLKMIYHDYYVGIGNYIAKAYGIQIDPATKNLSHACYLTYDPDAYLVEDGTDITPFDPLPWLPSTYLDPTVATTQLPSSPQPHRTLMTDAEKLEIIRQRIVATGTDITADYSDWIRVGFTIYNIMGDTGLPIFLDISSYYPKYSQEEAKNKYNSLQTSKTSSQCTVGTLVHLCAKHGLDINFYSASAEYGNRRNAKIAENAEKSIASAPTYPASAPPLTPELQLLKQAAEAFGGVSEHMAPSLENELPLIFRKGLSYFRTPEAKDVALISLLIGLSSITPNYMGNYGNRLYSTHLYACVPGEAAVLKSVMQTGLKVVEPIHAKILEANAQKVQLYKEQLEEYAKNKKNDPNLDPPIPPGKEMLYLTGYCSAAAFNRILADNQNGILLFETEGDTLSNILERDYGHYSETIRKAFHHELIASHLRTEDFELGDPRLAALISGTPDQIKRLIKDPLNGLFSRFLFLCPSSNDGWISQRPSRDIDQDSFFYSLGEDICLPLWAVLSSPDQIRYFKFTDRQWDQHDNLFGPILAQCVGELYNMRATIKRLGLIQFRIAMILTIFRRWESGHLGYEIVCEDQDFTAATIIMRHCLMHTISIYARMPNHTTQAYVKPKDLFYASLPQDCEYDTALWQSVARANGIDLKTAERYHCDLVKAGKIRRIKNGCFRIDSRMRMSL